MRLLGESFLEAVKAILEELGIDEYEIDYWDEGCDEAEVTVPNRFRRLIEVDSDGTVLLPDGEAAGWQYGVCVSVQKGTYRPGIRDHFILRFWQE